MSSIICTGPSRKIYELSGGAWVELSNQPAGGAAGGIWGGPQDTVWTHNGYYTGQLGVTPYYLHLDTNGTWSEHAFPSSPAFEVARDIYGSQDGQYVYAGVHDFDDSGRIHRYTSGSWTEVASGWRPGSIWCDITGQHVWAAPGSGDRRQHIYYSDDYGGTWTNIVSQLLSDTGDTGLQFGTCSVWGRSATEVYVVYGWINKGRIALWDGNVWSIVSFVNSASPVGTKNGCWLVTTDLDLVTFVGTNERNIGRDVSGVLTRTYTANAPVLRRECNGRSIITDRDTQNVYASFEGIGPGQESRTLVSDDGGATWSQITEPWAPAIIGAGALTESGWQIGVAPELQNQNPAPSSSGNDAKTDVYLEVIDQNGDLDASTVVIRFNGTVVWTGDAPVQPGYSGFKAPVTNGFGYTISLWEPFDPGSQDIRVTADDLVANSMDETYSFSTDAPASICDRVQWGDFQWGDAQWNQCAVFNIYAEAINEHTVRVFYNTDVNQIDPSADNDALNPELYIINGGFRNLDVLSVSTVNSTTVDLTVLEMTDGASYTVTVLLEPFNPSVLPFTGIGIHPFVTSVTNNTAGVLEVQFSEIMLNDMSFKRPSSYTISPQGNASSIFVTGVVAGDSNTNTVTLLFIGGGSYYILSTPGLMDPAGNYCIPPDFLFEIPNPTFDELEAGENLYFDTDIGPMRLKYSELTQQRVEDLAILRARNEGHLRQFSLISDELERSGIDRDARKLKLFKG